MTRLHLIFALLGGMMGGMAYQGCQTQYAHAGGAIDNSITNSAFRMANALERIAGAIERRP